MNGIGPKGALGLLSALSPDDLRRSIASGDAKAISKAPGGGVKTAQRVILDLKDKVDLADLMPVSRAVMEEVKAEGSAREAVEALTAPVSYTHLDYMIRATAGEGQIRAFAATTRDLVEEARKAHNTSPVATAALGRLLTAGAMMGLTLKGEDELLTLKIQGSGPIEGLTVKMCIIDRL